MNPQPINTLKVSHKLTINGRNFEIVGEHQYKFARVSKMFFSLRLYNASGYDARSMGKNSLRQVINALLKADFEAQQRADYYNLRKGLKAEDIINSVDFAYSRPVMAIDSVTGVTLGTIDYYKLYMKDIYSPTGVSLAGGCKAKEWERISKASNCSHQYLAPGERF